MVACRRLGRLPACRDPRTGGHPLESFSGEHPARTLAHLDRQHLGSLALATFCFVVKHSPVWLMPALPPTSWTRRPGRPSARDGCSGSTPPLDEATSAVDTDTEELIREALSRLRRGRTTLVVAHRLSTVRDAHRILVLEEGRVVEIGTHQALLAAGGLYARYQLRQSGVAAPPILG